MITFDNAALEFALKNRADLFSAVPIVFCGVNSYTPSMIAGHSNISGMAEKLDAAGTIELMLKLHPNTREILVINDYTLTGLSVRKETEALLPRFSGKIKIRFIGNLPMVEILKELEYLPADTLVLQESFAADKTGRTFNYAESTSLFFKHSPVPIYGVHEERLGLGIVGGKLLGGEKHGAHAARIALRILEGEKASAIPVVTQSGAQNMFDYKVMERFGLQLSALPAKSVVINKPVSFFAANQKIILIASTVILYLLVVIVFLIIYIVQRRRAAIALQKSEEQFRLLADNAPDAIFIQTQEKFVYVNAAFCRMVGAQNPEELLNRSIYDLFHPHYHAIVRDRIHLLNIEHKPVPNSEQKYIKLDKTAIHVDVAAVPFCFKGENGGLVFVRDITKRKETEEALRESEERFRSIIENADAGYFFIDTEGAVRSVNKAWLIIYGYENKASIIGKRFANYQKDDDIEKAERIVRGY
jgi:two-component system, cell cycle sensor histidine kinase and response regulator CckA